MHAGDNMLAIYASEKALRLAERLGETRVASRAHGIFGRVFGRIGDTAKARENLERSVELARDSDDGETIRALLTLGHHLEVSEADYDGAGAAYGEGLRWPSRSATCPSQVELHVGDRAGRRLPRRLGRGRGARPRPAPTSPSARAWSASSASRTCCAACSRGARRAGTRPRSRAAARTSWPSRSAGPRSRSRRCTGWRARCATAATTRPPSTELDRALDVCERAGLIAQSIEAMSARAITLAIAGKVEQGRETAEEAGHLAERLHYPVGDAAALEARAATAERPAAGQGA